MRERSVLLNLEGLPTEATVDGPRQLRRDVFDSLTSSGVEQNEVEGIECINKTRWFVVFRDAETRDKYLNTNIELCEKTYELEHPNPPKPAQPKYIHVYIYGYPLDADSETLSKAMSYYGPLVAMNDVIDQRIKVKTGVKDLTYERLRTDIPSYLYVGGSQIRTAYNDQPKTCRNCHKTGHLARDCTAGKVCRECGEEGHLRKNCPQQRCYECQETGHRRAQCPKKAENTATTDKKTTTKTKSKIDITEIKEGSDNDGDNEDSDPSEYETEEEDNENDNEDITDIPTETTPRAEPESTPMNIEKQDLKRPRTPEKESTRNKEQPAEEDTYLKDMVQQRIQRQQTNERDLGNTQAKKRARPPVSMGKNRNPWIQK